MKRSKKKGPFILLKHKNNTLPNKNSPFILKRNFEITFQIIGTICHVYDGKNFLKLNISENMVGHKLGEFVPTRAKFIFKKKKKNNGAKNKSKYFKIRSYQTLENRIF